MAYYINSTEIPRPKEMERSFAKVSADVSSISGRLGRDYRSTDKETFVLHWDNLEQSDLNDLLTLLESDEIVTFEIDEVNLDVPETEVIADIGAVDYETIGDTYLCRITVVLEEVG